MDDGQDGDGVAVGRRLGARLRTDVAAGADAILHHHRLAEDFTGALHHRARHDIGTGPGGEGHYQANGFVRIGLRERSTGTKRYGRRENCNKTQHAVPSLN